MSSAGKIVCFSGANRGRIRPCLAPRHLTAMEFLGFTLRNNLFVAPMAGVTDRPFRQLCKKMGAGLAVSEMVTSNSLLYGSAKTRRRANHEGEVAPISVQIAGAEPAMMAAAARYNVDRGAQIVDINMGCPAKKICNVMAGSALLRDEPLVGKILEAVVNAVPRRR
jgi:tRNA-dihydrouridine synthase B